MGRSKGILTQQLVDQGFDILATSGTASAIRRMGVPVKEINKIAEGSPHVIDAMQSGDVTLVVNTPTGSGARADGWEIRREAVSRGIPVLTTLSAGVSAARAIVSASQGEPEVFAIQALHAEMNAEPAGLGA